MSKNHKRIQKMRDNPRDVKFSVLLTAMRAHGFEPVRTTGSHQTWRHPVARQSLNIQPQGKDAKTYQVKQFLAMVSEYRLTHRDD